MEGDAMRETDVFTVRTAGGREYTVRVYGTDLTPSSHRTAHVPLDETPLLLTTEGFNVNRDGASYYIVQTGERATRVEP
jgi:hypothetical protein